MSLWETAPLPLAGYRNAPLTFELEVVGHDLTGAGTGTVDPSQSYLTA